MTADNSFNMAIGFSILFTVLTLGVLGYTVSISVMWLSYVSKVPTAKGRLKAPRESVLF